MKLTIITVALFVSLPCFAQLDSATVIFKGNMSGERYRVYWHGKLLLAFKANKAAHHVFKVPRDTTWIKDGYTVEFLIYRRSRFGLRYEEVGTFNPDYQPKKYLIISRNFEPSPRINLDTYWSEKLPLKKAQ
ncbi:hypothetical protein [Chryseolinea lacunae]|uniref:DUF2846 domain-containing protein n=1 Tax=Chryseolinea lacunae TaxID=2801331 RepID=A0ABS1KPL4_9BACT|nr:hypothetical protein [Chryseolinea lacunae]MBL0741408.1 hypothetical protein [Chryseolinea lacunae]